MKKGSNQKMVYEAFSPDAYLSTGISRAEILELKDAFDLLDSTGTGKLDPAQLRNLFKAYGVDQRNLSLELAFSDATANSKSLDFSAFLQIFTAYFYAPRSRDSLRKVFRLFDDENLGCVTAKNLRRVVKELGLEVQENQIQEMVERADLDNDGVVSEQQFYLIMTRISAKV